MKLRWKIYSFGYALLIILQAVYAFLPNSPANVYYRILISFNKIYLWQYILHYLSIFLELFGLVPLFLFIRQKKWLAPLFWKVFFFVKILGLCTGNYYEANLVGTFLAVNKILALICSITGLMLLLPYYIALYLYAFRQKANSKS